MIVDGLYYLGAVALLLGSAFIVLASIGNLRFPDFYTRVHAAGMAGAVGCGLVFLAVALVCLDVSAAIRAALGMAFLLITTPVAAHLLAKASLASGNGGQIITVANEHSSQNRA